MRDANSRVDTVYVSPPPAANEYESNAARLWLAADDAMNKCSCGKTPFLEFPLYTTQICTFVRCRCGEIAHGEPEDPMNAVLAWNAATGT